MRWPGHASHAVPPVAGMAALTLPGCEANECRAGRSGLLQPLAAQLFSHVLNVLQRTRTGRPHAQLSSGIGGDYAVVLRQYLLPVPAYCTAASVNDLQGE